MSEVKNRIPHIYIGSCVEEKRNILISKLEKLGITDYTVVLTEKNKKGRYGCWMCHKSMARKALEDSREVYITLEEASIPTEKFSFDILLDCKNILLSKKIDLIMLSRYHTNPFNYKQKRISKYVWENAPGRLENAQAMMMTSNFARYVLDQNPKFYYPIDQYLSRDFYPYDKHIANDGYTKYFCYPTCFARNVEFKSLTTPVSNINFIEKIGRKKKIYEKMDVLQHNGRVFFIAVYLLIICVVFFVFF